MNADDGSGSARLCLTITKDRAGGRPWQKYLFILGVFSLILTGCREETDLYFYTNQAWKVESALTVDRALIDLFMGVGGMAIGSELGVPVPSSILQSDNWISLSYDWLVNMYRKLGLDASWRHQTNTYILTVKGENFNSLPGVKEQLVILEPVAGTNGQYHLYMETLVLGGEMGDLGEFQEISNQLSMFGFGYERVITLHAGRIIRSNADEVRGGKAIWRNPTTVDAVFEPASPFPIPIVISFVCLGSLVGTITLAIKFKGIGGTNCPTCGKRVRKGMDLCPNCGGFVGTSVFEV